MSNGEDPMKRNRTLNGNVLLVLGFLAFLAAILIFGGR